MLLGAEIYNILKQIIVLKLREWTPVRALTWLNLGGKD